MATGIVTGPEERHSDCDDVSVEKKRATMSSKNPVYGQPTTEGAVGTPHNQPRRSESVERDHSSRDSSSPYRRIHPPQQVNPDPLQHKQDSQNDPTRDYSTNEPLYDLPNQSDYSESASRRFTLKESEQKWLPTTLDSKTHVLTRLHSSSTRESDNMLYETSDQRRSKVLFNDWMRQQRRKWRGIYAATLVVFLLSVAAVGLAVKQQLDGCSCESGDQPKTTASTGRQTSFEIEKQVVNTTLFGEVKRLYRKLAEQFIQIDLTSDLVTSVNNSVFGQIDQLDFGTPGPPGMTGPMGPPGKNGPRGFPGVSECKARIAECSSEVTKVRYCGTGLSPIQGYNISGVSCDADSDETFIRMKTTTTVKGETSYECLCWIPEVTQAKASSHVKCQIRLWECKSS